MMTEMAGTTRGFCRKLLLGLACVVAGALPVCVGLLDAGRLEAQAAPSAAPDLTGTWQGTLHAGQDLRTVVIVTRGDDGAYKGTFYSIDQNGSTPVTSLALQGNAVTMAVSAWGIKYEGKLSADGKTIEGTSTQGGGNPLALNFARATPETEWTIPKPAPPVLPMAADAHPSFEVATIKPSKPGQQGKGFGFRNGHFVTMNTDVNDLIAFAYGLHPKQIVGAPDWFGVDLFDIEGKPDAEGRPNLKQMGAMVQGLLTERFMLKFHHEQRELSVYVITVAAGGPKMTKTTAAVTDQQGFGFRKLGDLMVRNMTMKDFAGWMQNGVMDRPVVDQTGLTDRYDFPLKWTPDESQFSAFKSVGAIVPQPTDDPNAPPSLYTALQEQLGLKMAPAKAPDDVVVIDHVEKPSAN